MVQIYTKPQEKLWQGRNDGNGPLHARFFQKVELRDSDSLAVDKERNTYCFIGFACDEGVKRNQGRPGAALAPDEIRKKIANLPYHLADRTKIIDIGNIVCEGGDLEGAQKELGKMVRQILQTSIFPIILGGGHETLYGHYLGVRSYLGESLSLGIINIDAHFDLRENPTPTSGTMFRQILEEDPKAGYLALGIQLLGNTRKLFTTADKYNCIYVLEEDVENYGETFRVIDRFAEKYDALILTLCTDVITSQSAPGVSAPSPFGLDPKTVRTLIRYIAKKEHLYSFDISEVNPLFDIDGKTVRLAAFLIAEFLQSRNNGVHHHHIRKEKDYE